ncbi:hypothetical protein E0Z10_g4170 [Xylaria hypoxylon]|uniref:Fucose-specific lectin n=1 Tax=Xylaria hypoxylon TaxID=37992 RepID=A0A4Z0Z7U4_9PEZI|nr:hypothetical protein E0Z10_g4170 [Xylaria hypoxylon]
MPLVIQQQPKLAVRVRGNAPAAINPRPPSVKNRTVDNSTGTLAKVLESKFVIPVVLRSIKAECLRFGGGVGATISRSTKTQGVENPENTTTPSPILQNSSITAARWNDSAGNKEYRVYVQETEGAIMEAAWASNRPMWNSSRITNEGDDIMLGTRLTSSVGYPHANSTLPLLTNVYFLGREGTVYERQSKQNGVWGDDHVNGLYTASSDSSTFSFWYESFDPREQILAVMFQEKTDNSLSIARYTSDETSENHWALTNTDLQIQVGSALAAAPIGSATDLRLYVSDTSGMMKVYRYNLTNDSISDPISTNFDFPPHTALSISTQDNRNYFTTTTLPECATRDNQQFTHLILFPTIDRSSLNFISWNCSSGFLNQTTRIEPILQSNRTYLGLANTLTSFDPEDQRVYVLFDAGDGPEIEEWEVPSGAQNANWKVRGTIPVAFT